MRPILLAGTLVEIGAAIVALIVAVLAWQHRQKPAGVPVTTMALAAVSWALASALESLVADLELSMVLMSGIYLSTNIVAVSWLYIAVEYTGREWFQRRRVLAGVLGLAAVSAGFMLTAPIHGLIFGPATRVTSQGFLVPERGIGFILQLVWKYGIILVGMGLLVLEIRTTTGMKRLQAATVLLSGIVPTTASVIEVVNVFRIPGFNESAVGIALSGVILLWALFYADFLEVVPVARKTLMDSMDDAVVAVDSNQRVIDLNPLARELFDLDETVLGSPAAEVFADWPAVIDQFRNPSDDGELTIQGDGEPRYYGLKSSPIDGRRGVTTVGEGDESTGTVVVIRDITDRKLNQRRLQRQNERLDQFAAIVSHDLRNPLGVAETYLDFAAETGDPDDFEAVRESHERMDAMIDDLLTMARAETAVSDTDSVVVADIAATAWDTTQTGDATLDCELPDSMRVEADPSLLQNVFENLFRNSIVHNDASVRIEVGSIGNPESTGFYVEDDGTGIPDSEKDEVFDHGHTTSDEGTGLGLSIVSDLVEAHGWTISVTDSDSGGARFEVRLSSINNSAGE
jgi:signal transduction histidine kinase